MVRYRRNRFEYDGGHADLVERNCHREPADAAAGDKYWIIRRALDRSRNAAKGHELPHALQNYPRLLWRRSINCRAAAFTGYWGFTAMDAQRRTVGWCACAGAWVLPVSVRNNIV
jgi:hypothetical protein